MHTNVRQYKNTDIKYTTQRIDEGIAERCRIKREHNILRFDLCPARNTWEMPGFVCMLHWD